MLNQYLLKHCFKHKIGKINKYLCLVNKINKIYINLMDKLQFQVNNFLVIKKKNQKILHKVKIIIMFYIIEMD